MDPGTAMLIAAAVAASAKVGGEYFAGRNAGQGARLRAKETKRETLANLMNESMQGNAEMQANRLQGRAKLGKRKAQSFQDTSDIVRGAFNI